MALGSGGGMGVVLMKAPGVARPPWGGRGAPCVGPVPLTVSPGRFIGPGL
jgi:hypothetical protein